VFSLKMTNANDAGSSILVPFDQRWEKLLRQNEISVFFRKRGPRVFSPTSVFVYIAAPTSRLIGRTSITAFSFMPLDQAVTFVSDGGLTEAELRQYARGYAELAVFHIGRFEAAVSSLTLPQLSAAYSFHAPQSFLRLSESGSEQLEKALGFCKPNTGRATKSR